MTKRQLPVVVEVSPVPLLFRRVPFDLIKLPRSSLVIYGIVSISLLLLPVDGLLIHSHCSFAKE